MICEKINFQHSDALNTIGTTRLKTNSINILEQNTFRTGRSNEREIRFRINKGHKGFDCSLEENKVISMTTVSRRKGKIIKDANARRITLTSELAAMGCAENDEITITTFKEKGKLKILIEE